MFLNSCFRFLKSLTPSMLVTYLESEFCLRDASCHLRLSVLVFVVKF